MKKTENLPLAILFICCLPSLILAQKNPQFDSLTTKLEAYVNNSAPEKVYLQTDKDFYTKGDTIWFKTYLLNGITHSLGYKSNIIYVDLLDTRGSLVVKLKLYTDNGSAFGDIEIDDSIPEGDYRIRAYTKYMLNDKDLVFFEKEISILALPMSTNDISNNGVLGNGKEKKRKERDVPNPQVSKPNVKFFPEGGYLVTGLQSELCLKITDESGDGIALEGNILDQKGTTIKRFETHNFGLGVLPITPKADTNYFVEINVDGILHKYAVPTALTKGYVIQLKNQGSQVIIKVSTNLKQGLRGSLLLGHLRGEIFLKHSPEDSGKTSYLIKFPTSQLSNGIAHFTLFNQQGDPICERLTFIDNPKNQIDFTIKTDKSHYRFREKVCLDMSIFDTDGKPLQGDFSISVALDKSFDKNASNIKSWLLLNSDVGNTVENPNYFFDGDSNRSKNLLGKLMLTHGWRRFVWNSFLLNDSIKEPQFPAEKGIMVNGTTTAFDNRYRPERAITTLSILGKDIFQEKSLSDAQGKFSFGPLVFFDSVKAIISASAAVPSNNKNQKIAVHLDTSGTKVNIENRIGQKSHRKTIPPQMELKQEYRDNISDFKYAPRMTALSEVVVQVKKKTRRERLEEELNKRTVYGAAQNRLFPDSIPSLASATVFDLLTRVAGVQVLGTFGNRSARIRGISSLSSSGEPLYTVDGVPVSADIVQSITVNDILFVDVLKGSEAAFYGVRGSNGVVAIYTDRGRNFNDPQDGQEKHPGTSNFFIHGFYRAKEFYNPNYDDDKPEHKGSDYRTTLYWNPDVVINDKTQTKLNFYTGDVPGKYVARVEGITYDGRPVSKQYDLYVFD